MWYHKQLFNTFKKKFSSVFITKSAVIKFSMKGALEGYNK